MSCVALLGVALIAGACSSNDDSTESTGVDGTEAAAEGSDKSCTDSADETEKFATEALDRGEATLETAEVPDDLVIVDDVEGTGCEVTAGATVTVQYTGAAATTGQVFDSSWKRGEPAQFPLDGVIEGWSKGLIGMRSGGRRTLVIPPAMAYGDGGPAPGDALVFVVDMIGVINP